MNDVTPGRQWLAKADKFRKLASDAIPLITAAAFLFALALNVVNFFGWGLNFLQIASPGDVITSFFSSILPYLFAVPTFIIGMLEYRRSRPRLRIKVLMAARVLLMFVVVIINIKIVYSPPVTDMVDSDINGVLYLLAIVIMGALVGFVVAHTITLLSAQNPIRRSIAGSFIYLGLFGVAAFVGSSVATAEYGYMDRFLTVTPSINECNTPRLLWIGDKTIIVECNFDVTKKHIGRDYLPNPKNIFVLRDYKDIVIRPIAGYSPRRQ